MYKRQKLIKIATKYFATKGFDKTTTSQIAKSAGVTEPLLFYHFKSKNGLFEEIIKNTSKDYFSRFYTLNFCNGNQIEKIEKLFLMHLDFVNDMPEECYIFTAICPSRLRESDHVCIQNVLMLNQKLNSFLSSCLEQGIEDNEFHHHIHVKATAKTITSLLYGLLISSYPYNHLYLQQTVTSSIDFCRRSLLKDYTN